MRTGERSGEVFDALLKGGQIAVYPTEVERLAALTTLLITEPGATDRVIADTREQVRTLNAAIRDQRLVVGDVPTARVITTAAGERIGPGDQITTRLNDHDLGVANRDRWTVAGIDDNGSLVVRGRAGQRTLPPGYVDEYVELAYATTVHGAQGETVARAHLLVGETTGAAAAYVGMTRGRERNTAHLVAETIDEARAQWIEVFSRDRADLGPRHATRAAADGIERYGPRAVYQRTGLVAPPPHSGRPRQPDPYSVAQQRPVRGPSR